MTEWNLALTSIIIAERLKTLLINHSHEQTYNIVQKISPAHFLPLFKNLYPTQKAVKIYRRVINFWPPQSTPKFSTLFSKRNSKRTKCLSLSTMLSPNHRLLFSLFIFFSPLKVYHCVVLNNLSDQKKKKRKKRNKFDSNRTFKILITWHLWHIRGCLSSLYRSGRYRWPWSRLAEFQWNSKSPSNWQTDIVRAPLEQLI